MNGEKRDHISKLMNSLDVWRMMKRDCEHKSELLERWSVFGQQVINGAFHRNGDWDNLAAIATILIEDTED